MGEILIELFLCVVHVFYEIVLQEEKRETLCYSAIVCGSSKNIRPPPIDSPPYNLLLLLAGNEKWTAQAVYFSLEAIWNKRPVTLAKNDICCTGSVIFSKRFREFDNKMYYHLNVLINRYLHICRYMLRG